MSQVTGPSNVRRATQRIAELEAENERLRERGDWYKTHKKQAEAKLAEARTICQDCENFLADGDYGEEPELTELREKLATILKETP